MWNSVMASKLTSEDEITKKRKTFLLKVTINTMTKTHTVYCSSKSLIIQCIKNFNLQHFHE